LGELFIIVFKLFQDFLCPLLRQFNQKTLWTLNVEGCYKEVGVVGGDLHNIVAIPQLPPSLVQNNAILVEGLCLSGDYVGSRHLALII